MSKMLIIHKRIEPIFLFRPSRIIDIISIIDPKMSKMSKMLIIHIKSPYDNTYGL